jgi:hypothetical protein
MGASEGPRSFHHGGSYYRIMGVIGIALQWRCTYPDGTCEVAMTYRQNPKPADVVALFSRIRADAVASQSPC